MKNFLSIMLVAASLTATLQAEAKDYVVTSPDGLLRVTINDDVALSWSISRSAPDGQMQTIMLPSPIGIVTDAGKWGEARCVRSTTTRSVSRDIKPVVYKRAEIHERCNEMTLRCRGDFDLVVRAYNDGLAYRLVSKSKQPLRIVDETAGFAFDGDYKAFVPYVNDNRGGERYCYSFESYYDEQPLSKLYADSLAITPLAVCMPEGTKAVVMETAVENYPGMFLKAPFQLPPLGGELDSAMPPQQKQALPLARRPVRATLARARTGGGWRGAPFCRICSPPARNSGWRL